MRVHFAPFYKSNPYQTKLKDSLSKLSVKISYVDAKTTSLFKIKNQDVDIIHFHWIEPFYLSNNILLSFVKSISFLFWLFKYKKSAKIVWTVHNLLSHRKKFSRLERFVVSKFVSYVDAFSVHNNYTINQLVLNFNVDIEKIHIIKHANYVGSYPSNPAVLSDLKLKFNISSQDIIFMFLGYIRPYKGVFELIDSFRKVNNQNVKLIVAGKLTDESEYIALQKHISNDTRITVSRGFINDDDMASYLELADIMVYPYKDILTSGSLFLGMSYRKCCIAADVGSMQEFIDKEYLYTGDIQLTALISKLSEFNKEDFINVGERNYKSIVPFDWSYMADKTQVMYAKCMEDDNSK